VKIPHWSAAVKVGMLVWYVLLRDKEIFMGFSQTNTNPVKDGVAFLLRGAKKRRSMAIASARMINSDIGISAKLVAVK
jgi:hypothetical protein